MKDELNIILSRLDDIKYGFEDQDNNIYTTNIKDFRNKFDHLYYLQEPEKTIQTKYGVCWDQVELERYYLEKNNIDAKSYFIIAYSKMQTQTHTFLVTKLDKYYWLEHSWESHAGLHEYDSLNELLIDVKTKFEEYLIQNNIKEYEIVIYEYDKPNYGMDCSSFMEYCQNSREITI